MPPTETGALTDLQFDDQNANQGTPRGMGALESSLKRLGLGRSILVDRDNRIIAGNKTAEKAGEQGVAQKVLFIDTDGSELIAVRRTDLSLDDPKARELAIADNRVAELNLEWDPEVLQGITMEADINSYFTMDELNAKFALLDDNETGNELLSAEGLTDPDDVSEAPADPITKPGDLWILGNHRLLCGDSTDITAVERLMDGGKADLWLTDPPYNVALGMDESPEQARKRNRRTDGKVVSNDSMSDAKFRQFLKDAYTSANLALRPGAAFYIWHADSEGYNFRGAAADIGWKVRQCLIWLKSSLVMGRQDYQWKHEPCIYGWTENGAHFWNSDRKQTTILEFDKPSRSTQYPTMKPVELFQRLMANSTKSNDTVLDSFGGSGTTLIAAEKLHRKARLMELDPAYCDVIVKRWENFTGNTAICEPAPSHFTTEPHAAT